MIKVQDLELAFLVTTLTLSIALGLVSKRSNQDGLIFCGLCVLFAAIATMLYSYRDLALEPFRHAVPNVFFQDLTLSCTQELVFFRSVSFLSLNFMAFRY